MVSWRLERSGKAYGVILPLLTLAALFSAFHLSSTLLWGTAFFSFLYYVIGVTVGMHRLFAHKSFSVHPWLRRVLLWVSCQGLQGSPIFWAAVHRSRHHAYADTDLDLHSPIHGLWSSFIGWNFTDDERGWLLREYVKSKKTFEDKFAHTCQEYYTHIVIANLLIVALISFLFFGNFYLVLASLNGSFYALIITGLVNILGHTPIKGITYKHTEFNLKNNAVNNLVFGIVTCGEAFHQNHHAKPMATNFGIRWYEFDLSHYIVELIRNDRKN